MTPRDFLQHESDLGSFPGAAWAVGSVEGIEQEDALGHAVAVPLRIPATVDTIYDCASTTKVLVTTILVLQAVAEGKIALDDEYRGFSYRELLSHSSGLRAWLPLYALGDYLAAIEERGREHARGEQVTYSDLNFILLDYALQDLLGDYREAARTRIFEPLGLRDSYFNPPAALKPRIAPTEVEDFRGGHVWGVVHDETAWVLGGVSGNAGLFSSARDLAVFMQMLLNGGTYGTATIVRPTTVARWTARQRPDASRALGWDTPSRNSSAGRFFSLRSFGHTGFTGTSMWADPERELFVVLLTNRVNPTRNNQKVGPLRRAVADAVQQSIVDAPLRDWEALLR